MKLLPHKLAWPLLPLTLTLTAAWAWSPWNEPLTAPATIAGAHQPHRERPSLVHEVVLYRDAEGAELEGLIVRPQPHPLDPPRPGVLVSHQWTGAGAFEKQQAERLARLGFVAFVLDVYGKGIRADSAAAAGRLSGQYKSDRPLFRARMQAALKRLKRTPGVDDQRIGAVGYCFGGTAVLELARSGAELQAVVSFHGGLSSPTPEDAKAIRTAVLVAHGAADPLVPDPELVAFFEEMRGSSADWQVLAFGSAKHSFTDPKADEYGMAAVGYDAKADFRSWAAMRAFFAETLGPVPALRAAR